MSSSGRFKLSIKMKALKQLGIWNCADGVGAVEAISMFSALVAAGSKSSGAAEMASVISLYLLRFSKMKSSTTMPLGLVYWFQSR